MKLFRATIGQLESYVTDKIISLGSETLMGIIGASPLGAAMSAMNRFSDLIETKGRSELDDFITGQFHDFKFKLEGPPLLRKLEEVFSRPAGNAPRWARSGWAHSRQDWLNNKWRHDWRSQPRDRIGRWVPGRLDYPVLNARQIGKGIQRTSRKRRRINRYRRYGRMAARSYKFGGQ
jgi:hypothetical protein